MVASQKYVICLVETIEQDNDKLILVTKDKPDWQQGLLNLPGGALEGSESPEEAAIREFKEETGLNGYSPALYGKIKDEDVIVYCVKLFIDYVEDIEIEKEKPAWYLWKEVKNDRRLIPNLKLIVPLMMQSTSGWTVEGNDPKWTVKFA